jgi:hypothetical protein
MDKTWAELITLEVGGCWHGMQLYGFETKLAKLKLETQLKQLLGISR